MIVSVSHVLLGILAEGPAHGYDLKRAHDQRFPGARPLAFGQVYAALAKLEKEANRYTASDFLRALIEAVPYKIHTVLTDNGMQLRAT